MGIKRGGLLNGRHGMAGAEEASLSRESRSSNGRSTPLSPLFTTPTSIAAISVLIEFTHLNTTASGSRLVSWVVGWVNLFKCRGLTYKTSIEICDVVTQSPFLSAKLIWFVSTIYVLLDPLPLLFGRHLWDPPWFSRVPCDFLKTMDMVWSSVEERVNIVLAKIGAAGKGKVILIVA